MARVNRFDSPCDFRSVKIQLVDHEHHRRIDRRRGVVVVPVCASRKSGWGLTILPSVEVESVVLAFDGVMFLHVSRRASLGNTSNGLSAALVTAFTSRHEASRLPDSTGLLAQRNPGRLLASKSPHPGNRLRQYIPGSRPDPNYVPTGP